MTISPSKLVTIDKGIPLPLQKKRNTRYPWDQMEVGDSIATERMGTYPPQRLIQELGWRFTKRSFADGTFRVWRIK